MWQRLVDKQWLDESSRYLVTRLGRLFLFLRPRDVALAMFDSVLTAWEKIVHPGEIIRAVEVVPTEEAVPALRTLLSRYGDNSEMRERVLYALGRNRTPEAMAAVVELIKDGSLPKFIDSRTFFFVERDLVPVIARAIAPNPVACASLLDAIEVWDDSTSEALACAVLGAIGSPRAVSLICRYLDSERFPRGGESAESHLLKQFSREKEISGGSDWIEIHPQAQNDLRHHLFELALKPGPSQVRARNVLMRLELARLSGRPAEEPYHPDITTNRLWPDCIFE